MANMTKRYMTYAELFAMNSHTELYKIMDNSITKEINSKKEFEELYKKVCKTIEDKKLLLIDRLQDLHKIIYYYLYEKTKKQNLLKTDFNINLKFDGDCTGNNILNIEIPKKYFNEEIYDISLYTSKFMNTIKTSDYAESIIKYIVWEIFTLKYFKLGKKRINQILQYLNNKHNNYNNLYCIEELTENVNKNFKYFHKGIKESIINIYKEYKYINEKQYNINIKIS